MTIEVKEIDKSDLTIDTYRLKNIGSSQFLVASSTAQPLTMSDTGENEDRHWEFIKSDINGTIFYNIDSKKSGILRATGANFESGAYLVVSTTKSPFASDSDKIWTVHYNETNETFRFEAGSSGRFMYHDADGNVYSKTLEDSETRSVWKAISTSQTLSTENNNFIEASVNVYPNPTKNNFVLKFNQLNYANVKIYNILGKLVFEASTKGKSLEIDNNSKFSSGLYLIKVTGDKEKVYHTKLMIE